VYSGGLGVLAGDHIKSASDLGIPLIGIGLFYGQGYFRQRLDQNGWQQEDYLEGDVTQLPMEPAIGTNGVPVMVQIETRHGAIRAKVWRLKVGRCDLLLLDSNVEGNAPEDRELTSRLYGGDGRIRIRQELLLFTVVEIHDTLPTFSISVPISVSQPQAHLRNDIPLNLIRPRINCRLPIIEIARQQPRCELVKVSRVDRLERLRQRPRHFHHAGCCGKSRNGGSGLCSAA
jgi:hypothetical protein